MWNGEAETRKGTNHMELSQLLQALMGFLLAIFGFFMKRIYQQLQDGAARMCALEQEISRQKQQANDLEQRLDRIEDKIDRLLER